MINLSEIEIEIVDFLSTSIKNFNKEHQQPNSIGIYCCPWAGWLTSNFNTSKTIEETQYNCPDFEFVEYDFLELPMLAEEYERENTTIIISGKEITIDKDLGDEGFNKEIFEFLKQIGIKIKLENNCEILIQMLDSSYFEKLP